MAYLIQFTQWMVWFSNNSAPNCRNSCRVQQFYTHSCVENSEDKRDVIKCMRNNCDEINWSLKCVVCSIDGIDSNSVIDTAHVIVCYFEFEGKQRCFMKKKKNKKTFFNSINYWKISFCSILTKFESVAVKTEKETLIL